jgi:hypothetical protein
VHFIFICLIYLKKKYRREKNFHRIFENCFGFDRKVQQTVFVNGLCGAVARGAADLIVFPFTLIKARLEVRIDFI